MNHNDSGSDRGMSLATKASFGFMAQNEDDAVHRHHDMRWATITKLIDSEQKMIDVKMKLADLMLGNGSGDQLRMSVILMMDKIDKLNKELALLKNEKLVSNSIVPNVHSTSFHMLSSHFDQRISSILLVMVNGGTIHDHCKYPLSTITYTPLYLTLMTLPKRSKSRTQNHCLEGECHRALWR